jgi:uncharacterized protein
VDELLGNHLLWASFGAMLLAQVVKVFLALLTERRFSWERLLETGGMPSSHSAAVAALMVGLGINHGWDSPLFAVAAIFGFIVMYDATGIRRAAGMHAQLLNELVEELTHLFDEGFKPQVLKTLLGHTYPQVLVGAVLGVVVALAVFL